MKWPLYLFFASVTFSSGIIALSRGWNLPPQAAQIRNTAAGSQAASEEAALPACCAGHAHETKSDANSPMVCIVTTNEAGEREIVLPCCAGKQHTSN
jgi:hypothetical protein